jgi:LmbE family N-acetylglucosaminyl deacetylase
MKSKKSKILILAPHTDDAEFGCGGTINKYINEGHEVYCAAFSACEQSVLSKFPGDILRTEVKKATKRLGILPENLFLYEYKVRTMNYHRQEILDDLIKLRAKIQPDMVFYLVWLTSTKITKLLQTKDYVPLNSPQYFNMKCLGIIFPLPRQISSF